MINETLKFFQNLIIVSHWISSAYYDINVD